MRRTTGLLLLVGLTAAACGDSIGPITGGEGGGNTGFAVKITDDPANDPAPGPQRVGPQAVAGELVGSVRVSLRNDAGSLVDLGTTDDVVVELQQGADSVELEDLTRPANDTYVGIQLRFEGATATVFSGSEVGDTTLTEDTPLDVGSGGVATVEITTQTFTINSESEFDIVVDLNSELWITTTNIEDAAVPQADLANNVTVEIQ
jgi:hypothetical protein